MEKYLIVSAILFAIGTIGVLTRKNAIVIFMCIELMLNAVNLTFVAFSRYLGNLDGQIFVFFVMTVAAAEAAGIVGAAVHALLISRARATRGADSTSLWRLGSNKSPFGPDKSIL